MSREPIRQWLESHHATILDSLEVAGRDQDSFPHIHALPAEDLHALAELEWLDLAAYLTGDPEARDRIGETRRAAVRRVVATLPFDEHAAYLDHRAEVLRRMIEDDPETEPFRSDLLDRLERGVGYHRATLRVQSVRARMERLADEQSGTDVTFRRKTRQRRDTGS